MKNVTVGHLGLNMPQKEVAYMRVISWIIIDPGPVRTDGLVL